MKRSLLVCALFLMAGCGVSKPIQGRADPDVPSQIHLDSDELRRDTAFGTPIVTRNEADMLVVTVPVRSAVNQYLHVDYFVTFFDRDGVPIGPRMGPFTKTLDPNTPDQIQVKSTTPRAADFQLSFRYAR